MHMPRRVLELFGPGRRQRSYLPLTVLDRVITVALAVILLAPAQVWETC
jgi:hypothetical protein